MPIIGVPRDNPDTALEEMRRRSGTIEGYFAEGLGLDAGTIDGLRATCVERG